MKVFIVTESESYKNEIVGAFSSRVKAIKYIAERFANEETTIIDIRDYLNSHDNMVRFGNTIITIITEEIQ